jgi:hypothetical protein
MKEGSLKYQIYNFLDRKWKYGYEIEDFAKSQGYSQSNGARRARQLAYDHKVLRRQVTHVTNHNGISRKIKLVQFKRK